MNHLQARIDSFYKYIEINKIRNKEIVARAGFSKGAVSNIITRKVEPSENFLNTFEKVFNVDLAKYKNDENVQTKEVDSIRDNGVPYYDVDFAGGWSSEEVFANQLPSFYITSPDFEKAEFACNLIGQSISNRIPNRAVLGLRQIKDWEMYFPTNEVYAVLMKNDLRTVKIVKRSKKEGFLTLIPDPLPQFNQTNYEPEEVPVNFVAKMFQVVAWAQFERVAM